MAANDSPKSHKQSHHLTSLPFGLLTLSQSVVFGGFHNGMKAWVNRLGLCHNYTPACVGKWYFTEAKC